MRSVLRRSIHHSGFQAPRNRFGRRNLLTLAIETSCDDTCVAVLEKHANNSATLHFNEKITASNEQYGGIHPIVAHESHQKQTAGLVMRALQALPLQDPNTANLETALLVKDGDNTKVCRKPDFVAATRGPGMRSSLLTGMDTAKGLAVAWQKPFLGVNHMQAHALTPRLVSALSHGKTGAAHGLDTAPAFPYLSLLVSGGNTMLVHSKSLCDHEIIAETSDIAVGEVIDHSARDILPLKVRESAASVSFGPALESFAFPDQKYDYTPPRRAINPPPRSSCEAWSIPVSLHLGSKRSRAELESNFSFSGVGSSAKRISITGISDEQRRLLARDVMTVAFEHLASRVVMALQSGKVQGVGTLVVSGGVASNQYLKHILRTILDSSGYKQLALSFPPPALCTDNAAMIAWTAVEMFEAGYQSRLDALVRKKWTIDPGADDGGILGVDGWEHSAQSALE